MSPVSGGGTTAPGGGGSVDLGDIPGYTTPAAPEVRALRNLGTGTGQAASGPDTLSHLHVVVYDYTNSVWPARPSGVIPGAVRWIGPASTPPPGIVSYDELVDPT